jgi:uncharacterized protein YwbE
VGETVWDRDVEADCRVGAYPRVARGEGRMAAARQQREDRSHGSGGRRVMGKKRDREEGRLTRGTVDSLCVGKSPNYCMGDFP